MNATAIAHRDALAAWRRHAPAANPAPVDSTEDLLRAFHPDHRADSREDLRVGASSGDPCPRELARVLQANSPVEDVDLAGTPCRRTDVLIVGAGGAGCAAALTAARAGARVLLVNKLRMGDGNTVMAEGGMQAAVGADDSLQQHFTDTWRGGHGAADPALVEALVRAGPATVRWLMGEGMGFDIDAPESAQPTLRRLRPGGVSVARLLSHRDFTGLEMMRALREAVLMQSDVETLERHAAIELLTDGGGRCAGAVLHDLERNRNILVRAGATVLATGGAGRTHLAGMPTSNHYGATADGLVLAYRAGARLREIDSFQYHPTGMAWPRHLEGLLITEAVRSLGAHLINGEGDRFIDELAPRDVVAAAILRELAEGRGVRRDECTGVFLDTVGLAREHPGVFADKLVTVARLAQRAGIDPTAEPLLVRPTLHYQNGGVAVDPDGRTDVPGLLCAGEVTGGVHGRNRLMGNALLDIVVFGRRAGQAAVDAQALASPRAIGVSHLADWRRGLIAAGLPLDEYAPRLFPDYGHVDVRARVQAGREAT